MHKRHVIFTIATLILTVVCGGTPMVYAEETRCTGTIGAITLDNIVVPQGRTCTLNGTRAKGNVVVLTGATLSASEVRINGSIQAEGAEAVYINSGSTVGGNVQIKQGGSARVSQTRINGDLQLFENEGYVNIKRNRVGGNLQTDENTGGLRISFNVIAENLQCKQNTPPPTGSGNTAGDKEGQCAGL
jgi:hypothetical protein